MITYIDGKRCFINKVIYGDPTATAVSKSGDETKRPSFAAGDSDTDVTFLQYATPLKLVLNRSKRELINRRIFVYILSAKFARASATLRGLSGTAQNLRRCRLQCGN